MPSAVPTALIIGLPTGVLLVPQYLGVKEIALRQNYQIFKEGYLVFVV